MPCAGKRDANQAVDGIVADAGDSSQPLHWL